VKSGGLMIDDENEFNPPTELVDVLVLVAILAGGLIWYNAAKASSAAVTAAKQLMQQTEDQILTVSSCYTNRCLRSSAWIRLCRSLPRRRSRTMPKPVG